MTDAPRKRPWLQFSLATAVVMMLVAGGLLWANMRESSWQCIRCSLYFFHGWPMTLAIVDEDRHVWWMWQGLLANGAIACAVIAGTAVTSEYLIRRQERRP